jgi:hypothetical protein
LHIGIGDNTWWMWGIAHDHLRAPRQPRTGLATRYKQPANLQASFQTRGADGASAH